MHALNSQQQRCEPAAGGAASRGVARPAAQLQRRLSSRPSPCRPRCLPSSDSRSIREFIKAECPLPGIDGVWREQPKAHATIEAVCCRLASPAELLVPGQRKLLRMSDAELQQMIDDAGQVVLCVFEPGAAKVAAPPKGSWACVARVAGLQRLPGGGALVRLLVTDRVAVQALNARDPPRARAGLLRDRWCNFVRAGALQEQLAGGGGSGGGSDVAQAIQQVADAAAEVQQQMQQLAGQVDALCSAAPGGRAQQLLEELHEVPDELQALLEWCGDGASVAADDTLLERAWRLSFAPYAAAGLAASLGESAGEAAARRWPGQTWACDWRTRSSG